MDNEEDTDKNSLSEVVSDILKCQGLYCMDRVKVIRSVCLLSEKMLYDFSGFTQIKCGSLMAEGSWVSGSDSDHMYVIPGIIAVNVNCNYPDRKMHTFTTALDNCTPGYTRLQVQKLNKNCIYMPYIISMIRKDGNSLFLSSESFLKTLSSELIQHWTYPYGDASFYSHGPCFAASVKDLNMLKRMSSGKLECDIAHGIKCHSWPVAACRWKDRPRSKCWPSQRIVDIVTAFPVHVMPIGDYKCNESSMQWRFAFTVAERELIWNFNDIQYQCYILMKSIFREKLQPIAPDELSVYQIKNLLFWISEDYGLKMFTKTNLLYCLEICFKRFKQHILKGSLQHYFLHDRNLLAGKLDTRTQQRIADEIDKILEDIFVTIFESRHIFTPFINTSVLNMYNGSKKDFVCQAKVQLNYRMMRHPKVVFEQVHIMIQCNNLCLEMANIPNIDKQKVLAFIGNINSVKNSSYTILPIMLETVTRFGYIQLGMMLNDARDRVDKTQEEIDVYNWVSHFSFKIGFDLDELSGKLYSVTFELLNNKIDTAWATLVPIMSNTKPFFYNGMCMQRDKMWNIQLSNFAVSVIEYNGINGKILYSYDMIFPINVVHFVPEPVKFELSLLRFTGPYNSCVYHPVVYAFYLKFEITRKKNNPMTQTVHDILCELSTFVQKCAGSDDRYRAYNLLGYCYYVCGRIDEAIATFCLSMHEKADSKNVAVYHLCILLSQHVTSKTV